MEKRRNESDTFWDTSQSGFEFDDIFQSQDPDSAFSGLTKKDVKVKELDLLVCSGLTEAAENISPEKFSASGFSNVKKDFCPSTLSNTSIFPDKRHRIQSVCVISEPKETVKNMILGGDYSLMRYKKHNEKIELLKEAVKSFDGNVILEVVLFLKDTLKRSIFQRELSAHPDAVNVYLAYLEESGETDELLNILLLLGRTDDAAIFSYEAAVSVENPERKLKWIENCLSSHFQPGAVPQFYQVSVEEHKMLLLEQSSLKVCIFCCGCRKSNDWIIRYERSRLIRALLASFSPEKLILFEELCGKQSIFQSSVLCTLIFCYLFFYKTDEEKFALAERIKTNFRLSKKQCMWAAVRALAVSQRWQDIDSLFISKNWLSGLKLQSCIPASKVLEAFCKAKAPPDVMNKYISCIGNEDEKLALAKKYECHTISIQVFKNNKDRQGLIKYQSSLDPHSIDFLFASKVLKDPALRWKK